MRVSLAQTGRCGGDLDGAPAAVGRLGGERGAVRGSCSLRRGRAPSALARGTWRLGLSRSCDGDFTTAIIKSGVSSVALGTNNQPIRSINRPTTGQPRAPWMAEDNPPGM